MNFDVFDKLIICVVHVSIPITESDSMPTACSCAASRAIKGSPKQKSIGVRLDNLASLDS